MDYSDTIEISAPAERAFDHLSDLPAMGALSPENTGGEWLAGAKGPKVGARFRGTNARDDDEWTTIAKVTAYERPSRFVFDVTWHRFPIARWEFHVEVTDSGCRVTESWTDRRNAIIRKEGDSATFKRADFTKRSIRTTLENLKRVCENEPA